MYQHIGAVVTQRLLSKKVDMATRFQIFFALETAQIPLPKVWIQLFYLQRWVNSRIDLVIAIDLGEEKLNLYLERDVFHKACQRHITPNPKIRYFCLNL